MYLPGYVATVNGSTAEVRASRQGLAMIRIPAGASQASLAFTGPRLLQLALWLAPAAWLGLLAMLALRAFRWRVQVPMILPARPSEQTRVRAPVVG
jgi:hypothetical protein